MSLENGGHPFLSFAGHLCNRVLLGNINEFAQACGVEDTLFYKKQNVYR